MMPLIKAYRFIPIALYIAGSTFVFAAVAMNDDSVLAPVIACFGLLLIIGAFEMKNRGGKDD